MIESIFSVEERSIVAGHRRFVGDQATAADPLLMALGPFPVAPGQSLLNNISPDLDQRDQTRHFRKRNTKESKDHEKSRKIDEKAKARSDRTSDNIAAGTPRNSHLDNLHRDIAPDWRIFLQEGSVSKGRRRNTQNQRKIITRGKEKERKRHSRRLTKEEAIRRKVSLIGDDLFEFLLTKKDRGKIYFAYFWSRLQGMSIAMKLKDRIDVETALRPGISQSSCD